MERQTEKKKVVTPAELAESGWRVYQSCIGAQGNWDSEQIAWEQAATNAHAFIRECVEAETDVGVPQFARGIFEWLANGNGNYLELSEIVKLSFQAVARLWWGIMTLEEDVDYDEAEGTAFEWFQSRVARMNGSVKTEKAVIKHEKVEITPEMIAEAQAPQLETFPVEPKKLNIPQGAMLTSFKAVIQAKIDEYIDKAAALERYKATIPDDADAALAEVFSDIFKSK